MRPTAALLAVALAAALPAAAKPPKEAPGVEWLSSLDAGRKAAVRAGRPVLLVTLWGPGT